MSILNKIIFSRQISSYYNLNCTTHVFVYLLKNKTDGWCIKCRRIVCRMISFFNKTSTSFTRSINTNVCTYTNAKMTIEPLWNNPLKIQWTFNAFGNERASMKSKRGNEFNIAREDRVHIFGLTGPDFLWRFPSAVDTLSSVACTIIRANTSRKWFFSAILHFTVPYRIVIERANTSPFKHRKHLRCPSTKTEYPRTCIRVVKKEWYIRC